MGLHKFSRGDQGREVRRQGALPEPTVRSLMAQLLSALAGLHALGIVHRDIKPENLMVSPLADRDSMRAESEVTADMELHLTVIDFGYAALLEASGPGGLRGLSGSPEYAAPEVLRGRGCREVAATRRRRPR